MISKLIYYYKVQIDKLVYYLNRKLNNRILPRCHFGIAKDTVNNLIYVTDYDNHCIYYFDSTYKCLGSFGSYGSGDGEFINPTGIAIGGGYIYVADSGNNRIQQFDLDRNFIYSCGELDGRELQVLKQICISSVNSKLYFISGGVLFAVDFDLQNNIISKFVETMWYGIGVDETNSFVYIVQGGSGGGLALFQYDLSLNYIQDFTLGESSERYYGLIIDNTNGIIYIGCTDYYDEVQYSQINYYDLSINFLGNFAGDKLGVFNTYQNGYYGHAFYFDSSSNKFYVADRVDYKVKIFNSDYTYYRDFSTVLRKKVELDTLKQIYYLPQVAYKNVFYLQDLSLMRGYGRSPYGLYGYGE